MSLLELCIVILDLCDKTLDFALILIENFFLLFEVDNSRVYTTPLNWLGKWFNVKRLNLERV